MCAYPSIRSGRFRNVWLSAYIMSTVTVCYHIKGYTNCIQKIIMPYWSHIHHTPQSQQMLFTRWILDLWFEILVRLLQLCMSSWGWRIVCWIIYNDVCRSENKTQFLEMISHCLVFIPFSIFLDWTSTLITCFIPILDFIIFLIFKCFQPMYVIYLASIQPTISTDITKRINAHLRWIFCLWHPIASFADQIRSNSTVALHRTRQLLCRDAKGVGDTANKRMSTWYQMLRRFGFNSVL